MNSKFAEMFAMPPAEIAGGDYFFTVPWFESEYPAAAQCDMSNEVIRARLEEGRADFRREFEMRTFDGDFDRERDYPWLESVKGANMDAEIAEIFAKIAREGIPFMDIASSEAMGLASLILKLNPKTPCLVTDICPYFMKRLRAYINDELPESDISIATFDNFDMPLRDNSVEYVTSLGAISASSDMKPVDSRVMPHDEFGDMCRRKALGEVYRVLKPGGAFVTIEGSLEVEHDMRKIEEYFGEHELLFGMYTRDAVTAKLAEYDEWRSKYALTEEKIIATGFVIEKAKRHRCKLPLDVVAQYFSRTGDPVTAADGDRTDDLVNIYGCGTLYVLRKPKKEGL
jgi:Methylase involved in ubiquinone/menaquinone biosynthesis